MVSVSFFFFTFHQQQVQGSDNHDYQETYYGEHLFHQKLHVQQGTEIGKVSERSGEEIGYGSVEWENESEKGIGFEIGGSYDEGIGYERESGYESGESVHDDTNISSPKAKSNIFNQLVHSCMLQFFYISSYLPNEE